MTGTPVDVPVPSKVTCMRGGSIVGGIIVAVQSAGLLVSLPGFFQGAANAGLQVHLIQGHVPKGPCEYGKLSLGRMPLVQDNQLLAVHRAQTACKPAFLQPDLQTELRHHF